MKKNLLKLAALTLVTGVIFTGCGSSSATSSGAETSADSTASAAQTSADSGQAGASDESSSQTAASDGELYHLKIGYSPSLCQAPLQLALDNGFYKDEGLDVEFVQIDAAEIPAAVGADKIDAGFGLIGKFLQPIENGLAIKFTAGIHTGCIKVVAKKDSGIDSVADLKGKKIGVPSLADAATQIAKRALFAEGISFDETDPEVEFVVYDRNSLGQALENGAIDAIASGDPTVSQFVDQYDLNVILDTASTDSFKDEYCCGAFVSTKLYEEHPDVAAAFTRAILKSSVWVENNTEEAAQMQLDQKYVSGELDQNVELLNHYNYNPSVQGGYDAIKLSAEQLAQIGILKEDTDAQAFADNAFAFFDDVPDTYSYSEISQNSDDKDSGMSEVSTVNKSDSGSGEHSDCH